jgi:hypothetical protein
MVTTRWEARIDESHFLTGWRVLSVLKKDAQPEINETFSAILKSDRPGRISGSVAKTHEEI